MGDKAEILDRFVVFEGLDGAGTSTQLAMLRDAFQHRGTPCFATCEPTDGAIGRLIRTVLRGELEVSGCTLALLFAADRGEHLHAPNGVLATLRAGGYVASDRYLFSSLVYQSTDCSADYVAAINARFPLPRQLIFIDTPPEECQRRVDARGARELFDRLPLQRRLRERYLEVIARYANLGVEVLTIDGSGARDAVFARIWRHFEGI
jgi:dTMP kinase